MTEQGTPNPPPPGPRPASERPEGSFALGYVGGGIAMLVSLVFSGALIATLPGVGAVFLLIPPAAIVALLVIGMRHGKRTGKGVLAALLTLVGLVVMLVAACFGYFAIHPLNIH